MSHFSVLICLPAGTELAGLEDEIGRRMAPWDEDLKVAPYRVYEEGGPEDYWWVRSVRDDARAEADGEPVKVHGFESDRGVWSNKHGKYITPAQARWDAAEERREDAGWATRLGPEPTWEDVVRLYNERYDHGTGLALPDDDTETQGLRYDPESGRAYEVSTYSKASKWDYWRIGGRWGQGYFAAKSTGAGLIQAARGWDSPTKDQTGQRADGGPRGLLDFAAMREQASTEAGARFDRWTELAAVYMTADTRSWSEFLGMVEAKALDIAEARRRYHAQPLVVEAERAELSLRFDGCPIDEFRTTREEYMARAAAAAVPGYALVTLKGEWLAPGEMGWFGMSSDEQGTRDAYHVEANRYLDELGDDDLVVVLDCHI